MTRAPSGAYRWNRLWLRVLCLSALSDLACGGAILQMVEFGNFIASDRYAGCFSELDQADQNKNLKLSEQEYVTFIDLRTNGRINLTSYVDLPLSLISNYIFAACACTFWTSDAGCCVGEKINVDLNRTASALITGNLVTFCSNVDSAITLELGPSPAPSMMATNAPSLAPTLAPTLGPTSTPSHAPTLARTLAPTRAPTHAPTPPAPTMSKFKKTVSGISSDDIVLTPSS